MSVEAEDYFSERLEYFYRGLERVKFGTFPAKLSRLQFFYLLTGRVETSYKKYGKQQQRNSELDVKRRRKRE